MNRVQLFIDLPGEERLEAVAGTLASTLGMPRFSVRESSHYLEGMYFQGRHGDLEIEVSLCERVWTTMRYRIQIRSNAANVGAKVDEIVERQLMPVGFICKRVVNFGCLDQQELDYPKQS